MNEAHERSAAESMSLQHHQQIQPPFRALLLVLAGVFALRVLAQFGLQYISLDALPSFDAWHSETMSYRLLLFWQIAILAVMAWAIASMPFRRPRPRTGQTLVLFGWLYVMVMVGRLGVGAFDLLEHSWFDGAVSTVFHFGLAAFLLVFGEALRGASPTGLRVRWPAYFSYPLLLIGSYLVFVWLRDTGAPLLFSSYLSVLVGGLGIVLHESFLPARDDWRPHSSDVASDSVFLVLVQVSIPFILKASALAVIVAVANTDLPGLDQYWPSDWPILAQVALMLLIAEFFRYWLHRVMHEADPLWRLHAVHHASEKLYTVNVGRFHPLDKALQFFGDTLPFLILGVGADVFAAYFVLYAVNGFYQHSNAEVRLGPFNWIIAGPELHRWHHSAVIGEGHTNYGNNLIVWDVVFGTRFLPKGRSVERIGIGNRHWPRTFLGQLTAPFTQPTEHEPR